MIDRRFDRLIRMPEVMSRTGMSRATIYRKQADGTFPKSIRLGHSMIAWYENDVNDWIANPMEWRLITPPPD